MYEWAMLCCRRQTVSYASWVASVIIAFREKNCRPVQMVKFKLLKWNQMTLLRKLEAWYVCRYLQVMIPVKPQKRSSIPPNVLQWKVCGHTVATNMLANKAARTTGLIASIIASWYIPYYGVIMSLWPFQRLRVFQKWPTSCNLSSIVIIAHEIDLMWLSWIIICLFCLPRAPT